MSKLQVANGRAERTVNAFGIQILVTIDQGPHSSGGSADMMLERLTMAWRDSPVPNVLSDDQPVVALGEVTESNYELVHSSMSTLVTLSALKAHAGNFLMLHAGGIARADGSVAVIVGPSGRGKTTTMRELGRYFGYVSDETIAISDNGEILPYRKPLSVVTAGHTHKLQMAPSDLGLLPLPEARLYLGGMVLLERGKNGETESKVSSFSFARGIAFIVEQSSYLIELENPLSVVCSAVASVGGIKLLTVGHPSRIHEVADQLFENKLEPLWRQVMPMIQVENSSPAAYLPAEILDAVECEDGTVVLTKSSQAIVLEGIGPHLWRAACLAESWEDLMSRVELQHGPAPTNDSKASIQRVAEELIAIGVLRLPSNTEETSTDG